MNKMKGSNHKRETSDLDQAGDESKSQYN